MDTNFYLIGAAVLVVALLLVLVLAGRRAKKGREGDSVTSAGAAAVEDIVDELIGVDSHPTFPEAAGPPDVLTTIKGLGPKAAARLNALGITRFDQLAALDPRQQASLDAQMETFQGRMARDRWIEQADHLARDDRAGFEEKFGKLG